MKFQTARGRLPAEDTVLAICVGALAALATSALSVIVIEIVEPLRRLDFPFLWNISSLFPSFLPYHP